MKQQLLTIAAAGVALAMSAQSTPTIKWGNLIDGPTSAGDQSTGVVVNKSGDVYWYGTYGSNDANGLDISYDGETLFTGAHYEGTSNNGNLTILKTDTDGKKLWVVYSNSGDFANNAGGIAATSDGGCVVVSKVRHTDGYLDQNITLNDAVGGVTDVEWTAPEKRYYRMMVTKLSDAGQIEWNRMVNFSTEPGPGATGNYASFWSDVFNVGKIDVDDNDNIYIALNYRNPVTISKADGTSVTFTPRNNTTWTGDSQAAAGDFMVLSLDSDGYYRNALQLEGTATAAYCQKVAVEGGKVYAQGYINGDGTEMSVDGKALKPNSGVYNPLLMCADTDLNVEWAKCYPGEKVGGKHGFQNCDITVVNGNLWFVGQYNLKFSDPDEADKVLESTQGNLREGFILKLDAATGRWLAARNSRDDEWSQGGAFAKTGLTGYMGVMQNPQTPGDVYVMGYVMNNNVGVILRRYNADTLEGDLTGEYNLVTGNMPSFQCCAYDPKEGAAYFTARSNKEFTLMDGTVSATPQAWGILASKVQLPEDMQTSLSGISSDFDEEAPVEYYTLQGLRVAHPERGQMVIVRQGSKTYKTVVR